MNWYEVKIPSAGEEFNEVWHRSVKIEPGKKLLLTSEQAEIHGLAVKKSSNPSSKEECAFVEQYEAQIEIQEILDGSDEES